MTDFLWLTRDYRESNRFSIAAAFQLIRRQPWKALASGTWNIAKRFLQITVVAASLGSLFSPLAAHAQSHKAVDADIPFEFNIGNQPFSAGRYQLVFSAPGLLTLRDAQRNPVASFFAHYIPSSDGVPTSKLTFKLLGDRPQLDQIWIADSQKMEVIGREVAIRQSRQSQEGAQTSDTVSIGDNQEKRSTPDLRQ